MTNRKKRHPAFCLYEKSNQENRERRKTLEAAITPQTPHAISQSAKRDRQQAANEHHV
jgi:hypothetical protein